MFYFVPIFLLVENCYFGWSMLLMDIVWVFGLILVILGPLNCDVKFFNFCQTLLWKFCSLISLKDVEMTRFCSICLL